MKRKFELELSLDQISALNIESRNKINILHSWLYELSPQAYIGFLCDFADWVLMESKLPTKDDFKPCASLCLDYIRDFIFYGDKSLLNMAKIMSFGLYEKYKIEYEKSDNEATALFAVNTLCNYIEDESHISLSAIYKILFASEMYYGKDVAYDWVLGELIQRIKKLIPC